MTTKAETVGEYKKAVLKTNDIVKARRKVDPI
jgi:hypothetical protein